MLIYFNGDSNSAGAELEAGQSFADIITRYYNAKAINESVSGCSCDHILRTTKEYIEKCRTNNKFPDLIIIGWSEWNREEWYRNGTVETASSIFQSNLKDLTPAEQARLDYFAEHISGGPYTGAAAAYYNNLIYNLHCELLDLKIPHLFFNAIMSLDTSELMISQIPVFKHDFKKNFFHPYDHSYSMRQWCLDNNFKEMTPGYFHFEPRAQQAWASQLLTNLNRII